MRYVSWCLLVILLTGCGLMSRTPPTLPVTWEGGIDYGMVEKAREQITAAQLQGIKELQIQFASPGGAVIPALMLVREVLGARTHGLVVAIHGHSVVASAGIWVLGAGTPGRRTIAKRTLVLVHGLQVGGGFYSVPECVDDTKLAERDHESRQAIQALLQMIREMEAELSGKTVETVREWSLCGKERAGNGSLLVELGLADHVED